MTTIKVVDPDDALAELEATLGLALDERALMDLLWVRHGEPERIAPGRGVPADPALTARGREQAERLAAWLAFEPIDVVLSSPQRRAVETAAPIARAHGLDGSDRRRAGRVRRRRPTRYIPMEELRATNDPQLTAMVEGRWEEFGAEPPDDVPGPRRDHGRRDRRRASGSTGRRGVPRRRHQRRPRDRCSASTATSGSSRATRRSRAMRRVAHGRALGRVAQRARAPRRRQKGVRMNVDVEHDGPRHGRDDRPARRCATRSTVPTAAVLADAFRAFDADDDARRRGPHRRRRHVLRGRRPEGGRRRTAATRCSPRATARWARRACCSSKPVIAAVEGYAVAGGLELALWCDLRVAARDAVFGVFCRRWGVPLVDGGTVRLPRLIGHSHALDLILTGRGVSGDEALRMGLANRLTEPGDALDGRAIELAAELARAPADLPARRPARRATSNGASALDDAIAGRARARAARPSRSGESLAGAIPVRAPGAGRHGAPAREPIVRPAAMPVEHRADRGSDANATVADLMSQPGRHRAARGDGRTSPRSACASTGSARSS